MSSNLFTPLKVGAITVPNRVLMAPLTRLRSIEPGDIPTPLMGEYYRQRASSGLIISEATQISAQAKGYAGAPGLHSPEQIAAWKKITDGVHAENGHMAVQLWHTGRISHNSLQPGGQAPVAPSAISAGTRTSLRDANGNATREDTSMPRALETSEIPGIVNDFRQAVINARDAGFDLVELHSAHGYLLHQFLSPLTNQRTDNYGGSLQNRMRLVVEIYRAVRDVFPAHKAVGVRISATDGVEGGWDLEQSVQLSQALHELGCDFIHVSSGGLSPLQQIHPAPNYQVPYAQRIKQEVGITTIAVGLITEPEQAEAIVATGEADAIGLARAILFDPRWPWHAAVRLGAQVSAPAQYWRSEPRYARGIFKQ